MTLRLILIRASLAIVFIGWLAGTALPQSPDRDLQSWHDFQVTVPFGPRKGGNRPRTSLLLFGTLRIGGEMSKLIDERVGAGVEFRINRRATVAPGILFRRTLSARGSAEYETRLRTDVNLEARAGILSLRDRNRIEYRMRTGGSRSFRYRNRVQLSTPINNRGKEVFSPFVSYEFFADLTAGKWARNEYSVGINRKVGGSSSVDVYYLFQHNRSGRPRLINVIGLNWRIRLD
jgi:hypothetical protein